MPVGDAAGRTGHGTAITFGTSSFTASYHEIEGLELTRKAVRTSHLGLAQDAEHTYVPSDLIDTSPQRIRMEWNSSVSPPVAGAPETVTITYPLRAAQTVAGTLAGTAFVTQAKGGDITVDPDGVMVGEFMLQWDGLTGPTYTAGS
jgi:hypothetical protein